MFQFPPNPQVGQTVTGPDGQVWRFDGVKWIAGAWGGGGGGGGGGINEAPVDGVQYGRQNTQWTPIPDVAGMISAAVADMATQTWVDQQLSGYWPLTGGTITLTDGATIVLPTGSTGLKIDNGNLEIINGFGFSSGYVQSSIYEPEPGGTDLEMRLSQTNYRFLVTGPSSNGVNILFSISYNGDVVVDPTVAANLATALGIMPAAAPLAATVEFEPEPEPDPEPDPPRPKPKPKHRR